MGTHRTWMRLHLFSKEIQQIIPLQSNAVKDKKNSIYLQQWDETIERIKRVERKEWKKETDYHKRSLSETNMFRFER